MEITPHEGDGWAAFINSLHTTDATSMKTRTKTPRLNYAERLVRAYQQLNLPPQAIIARVQHDRRCPVLRGKAVCKCVPDIVLETDQGRIEVLADGSCRHMNAMN
jgi:hypothetical protein